MTDNRTCPEWKNFVCPTCGGTSYHDCERWKDGSMVGFCCDCLDQIIEHSDGRICSVYAEIDSDE
jgi:hypothetical protein